MLVQSGNLSLNKAVIGWMPDQLGGAILPNGTLAVITDAGDVFGVNVAGHDLGPRFQFGGGDS